jgi:hypothetical protein
MRRNSVVLPAVLGLVVPLAFTACGDDANDQTPQSPPSPTQTSQAPSNPSTGESGSTPDTNVGPLEGSMPAMGDATVPPSS